MTPNPFVFIDVDTQRDFLEPTGALYIRGSEAIVPNLRRLTGFARTQGIRVLATSCAHTPGDPELEQFPPHCMVGTWGQYRVEATERQDTRVLHADELWDGPLPLHLTLEKRALDLFSHPDADRLVGLYNSKRPDFAVYGVATDYCVECAVLGLLRRGCRVTVVVDAIRGIDQSREGRVLTEFVTQGATLALTDRIVGAD